MVNRAYIIAEAGVNHNGDLRLAEKLVDAAAEAGADAVKFQTFKADKLVSKKAKKARYQIRNTRASESQYEMIKRLELSPGAHRRLIQRCKRAGIDFLSSPFDEASADLLGDLGVRLFKIPSGEITNEIFLKHVAKKGKPMILSTGMSGLGEVDDAVRWIRSVSKAPLTLLHCVTEYPAPVDQINLKAMDTLRMSFGLPAGYSDHTPGIEIAVAAAARGAAVIEKHFTLDCGLPGPDHKASLEPEEFGRMTVSIRNVEAALGDGIKRPAPCEIANMKVARKSLVASRDLNPGDVLREKDISVKRPGDGIPPRMKPFLVGRPVRRKIREDEVFTWLHV